MLAVLVVTYNNAKVISACLKSVLVASKQLQEGVRVKVIDNASTDSTNAIVAGFKQVELQQEKINHGFSKAVNKGLKWAYGQGIELVLVLNPDTVIEMDALHVLMKYIGQEKKTNDYLMAVQPMVTLYNHPQRVNTLGGWDIGLNLVVPGAYFKKVCSVVVKPRKISFFSGAAVVLDVKHILRIGGFDEKFFLYYEDTELSRRIRLFGGEIHLCPQAVVKHRYSWKNPWFKLKYLVYGWYRYTFAKTKRFNGRHS